MLQEGLFLDLNVDPCPNVDFLKVIRNCNILYLVDMSAAIADEVEHGGETAGLEDGARLPRTDQLKHLDTLLRQISAGPIKQMAISNIR